MHLNENGAARRPKLGLSFIDKPRPKPQRCASGILTNLELRRLVAEMID